MAQTADIVVVGGGASGLAAAVFCAQRMGGDAVLLLEKAPRVGKKLLVTGNGTCNITNLNAAPSRYHGAGAESFVAPALKKFPPRQVIKFFDSLGVLCIPRDNGRVYPLCEQAGAVLSCLRLSLGALGVRQQCECPVTAIRHTGDGFVLTTPNGTVRAGRIILAAGGAASPSLGGTSDGYALAASLGHRKTALFPSIVQLRTDPTFVRAMKGLRTDATVTLRLNGAVIAAETGEVLFTDYGLSGPAVMQLSRVAGEWEARKRDKLIATLDLLPTLTREEVRRQLTQRRALNRRGEDFLTGLLNKRIGETVCRVAGVPLAQETGICTEADLHRLCSVIKEFDCPVTGTQGMKAAQVTAGGIATGDIDPETMESRLVKGLYLTGEVTDVDGDCGGFNLQWAWASAYAAACAAAGGGR